MTNNDAVPNPVSKATRLWGVFRYFPPNFSGAATQGVRLLSALAAQGYAVEVLAAGLLNAKTLAGKRKSIAGLEVRYLPVIQPGDWRMFKSLKKGVKLLKTANHMLSNLSFSLKVDTTLRQEAHPGDVFLWFTHNESTIFPLRSARLRGVHTVIRLSMMGSDDPASFTLEKPLRLTTLRSKALQACDAVVCPSSALQESCLQAGIPAQKVWYIPNGIDLDTFQPIPIQNREQVKTSLHLPPKSRLIVFVGSAKYRKGIDVLVRAFIRLSEEISDINLVIVGPHDFSDHTRHPPERKALVSQLRDEIAQAGLAKRVHWIGEVEEVCTYLQAADVFCFPSRREGLPTAVIEAMACGLPIIASRLEGITTDLIGHGEQGLLIEGYEAQDFTQALSYVLKNPSIAQEMGYRARARAERQFSLETVVAQYARLYQYLNQNP